MDHDGTQKDRGRLRTSPLPGIELTRQEVPSGISLDPTAASRLCAACGMCCNGVLFHTVQMQPTDSPRSLSALGLKLKRKRGQTCLQQPCPAFGDSGCSIYEARPVRCRLFECHQLKRLTAAEITEESALSTIQGARQQVTGIVALLEKLGGANSKHPLSKRWKAVLAIPMDSSTDPTWVADRDQLLRAIHELNALLDREFRIVPVGDTQF